MRGLKAGACALVLTAGTLLPSAAPVSPPVAARMPPVLELAAEPPGLDLQAHRGGRGEHTEESLAAFAEALELGVGTLELDTHLTQDGAVVVWHDDTIKPQKCRDTAPGTAGDPEYPYVGDRVEELDLAQLKTLDCGFAQLPGFPDQEVATGHRIAVLADVFALVHRHGASRVRLNIETKVEDGQAGGAGMVDLTRAVVAQIQSSGLMDRTTVQSFDWSALNLVQELEPRLVVVALAADAGSLGAGTMGRAAQLGGIDIDDHSGSLVRAAAAQGYDVVSPRASMVTGEMVREAREEGLRVIPWTVNTVPEMKRLMALGVDGMITDYPSRLRAVMEDQGYPLPPAYPAGG